jgi:5-methylcytosine-specific restriction endonuclease McrA
MFTYGFWFYEELALRVGVGPGKHRGDRVDAYTDLTTPDGATFKVKVSSLRLELFRQNPKCVSCHRIGELWILEAHHRNEPPHLNLYHVGEESQEWKKLSKDGLVMMTKDHIIPRSKGGPTTLENLQTMCAICNGRKGNQMHAPLNRPTRAIDPLVPVSVESMPVGYMQNMNGKIQFA